MVFSDYFIISLFYFWASSTSFSLGIGYYTVYRPIMAGMVTGFILNNVQLGMLAGALVNIIYIDFVSTGGSFKGDQCLTAIIAATATIVLNLHPLEGAAIAFPFGFLGILIWKYRLRINNIFVHMYEKNYSGKIASDISIYNGILPQLLLYLMSCLVTLAALFLMFSLYNILTYYINIDIAIFLYYIGLLLVVLSSFNILDKIHNKYNYIIFATLFIITLIFDIRSYLLLIVLLFILVFISDKKIFR
ncbi:MAG: PTS sugar transporter subunit IIC, partial [Tissierellia bacterium]|nr:PTS sugar transporter subunit IIC [Tissierellia bacterium]